MFLWCTWIRILSKIEKNFILQDNDICAMCIKVKNHIIAWDPNKMMKGVVHNIPISNGRRSSSFFLSFPGSFSIQTISSNWNYNCSNVLDLRNPGTSKNAFCFKKLICLFTVLFFLSLHCVKRYQFENSLDILCCDKKKEPFCPC